jgi:hypothetical protein
MVIHVTDSQLVGETLSTLWSTIQQGPVSMSVVMKNSGVNTMNYRFQEFNGTAWVDMGTSGSDYYNTLQVNEVKLLKVVSNYPQVQVVGNASGGAFLEFAVTRYVNRASGGSLPILNL